MERRKTEAQEELNVPAGR